MMMIMKMMTTVVVVVVLVMVEAVEEEMVMTVVVEEMAAVQSTDRTLARRCGNCWVNLWMTRSFQTVPTTDVSSTLDYRINSVLLKASVNCSGPDIETDSLSQMWWCLRRTPRAVLVRSFPSLLAR